MSEYENNRREFKVPKDVEKFATLSRDKKIKKIKKKGLASKEKDAAKIYYADLYDQLPRMLEWVVRYGRIPAAKDVKEGICNKIKDKSFIKFITKRLKHDETERESLMLLPIVSFDIMEADINKYREAKTDNDEAEYPSYVNDLLSLGKIIVGKKLSKLVKHGVSESLATDLLMIVPTSKVIKDGNKTGYFRVKKLMQVLYKDASVLTEDIHFDKIVKYLFNSEMVPTLITMLLLEKNETKSDFNENQIKVFNDITKWCFNTMSNMSPEQNLEILTSYVNTRKKDAEMNRDSNRRFFISSLPDSDEYKTIWAAIRKIEDRNPNMKEYL